MIARIKNKYIYENYLYRKYGVRAYNNLHRGMRRLVAGWPKVPDPNDEFTFTVSTGRVGTNHLAKVFGDENSCVRHEFEHDNTHVVMEKYLRPIARNYDRATADAFVRDYKIPGILQMMRWRHVNRFFDTGHQNMFGVLPSLLEQLQGKVRILRVRRDPMQVARSYFSLPGVKDPWLSAAERDGHPKWVFCPTDSIVISAPEPDVWEKLNRFQRYLWYAYEIERQWQDLLANHLFRYLEVDTELLDSGDYERISSFTGIEFDQSAIHRRHNSSQQIANHQNKALRVLSTEQMKEYVEEYHRLTGTAA